ncbi:hypothetical protein [Azospirillum sp. sgz301742]
MTREALLARLLCAALAEGLPLARLDAAADPAAPIGGGDADLLAAWRPWRTWLGLVRRCTASTGWRLLAAVPRGTVLILFLGDRAGGFLQIDLHRALTARGVPFLLASDLLARGRPENGALRLDPSDALGARELEHRMVHGRPRQAGTTVPAHLAAEVFGAGKGGRAMALLRALRRHPWECVRVLAAKVADATVCGLRPPGSLWIVCGPDGAGKTALLGVLTSVLPRRLARGVRVFHTRPFLLPRLVGLFPSAQASGLARPDERRPGRIASWIRLAIAWADWVLGYWLIVRPCLVAGNIVLFDRYVQDYLVAPERRGIGVPEYALAFVARRVPKGDGRIVVVADTEVLLRRKDELSPEEAVRQVAAYRHLARGDAGALLLDGASAPPEGLAGAVLERMMEVMARHACPADP